MPINNIGGAKVGNLAPLISFNCVIDTDMGLINLINKEYRNDKIFDLSILDLKRPDLINKLYYRQDKNPLYVIMKSVNDKEFLDECYKEFMETQYDKILSYSVCTEIMNLIDTFNNAGEISASIFYSNEMEKKMLDDEQRLLKNEFIKLPVHEQKLNKYAQIFLKTISEYKDFSNVQSKTFYFSTCGLNLNKEMDDMKDSIEILDMIRHNNKINLFDIYKKEIIGRKPI